MLLGVLMGLVALQGAPAQTIVKPWAGGATPPLVLQDLEGATRDLASLHGRVVLVNFWATWCEPCTAEMPSLQRLRKKLGGQRFAILAVNDGESRQKVEAFLREKKVTLEVLLDPDQRAVDDWKARGLPTTFLVGADGKVRYSTYGERDWSDAASVALVEGLMKEKPGARR
jgi:thiol-disulfide isomerase/thioredoxin